MRCVIIRCACIILFQLNGFFVKTQVMAQGNGGIYSQHPGKTANYALTELTKYLQMADAGWKQKLNISIGLYSDYKLTLPPAGLSGTKDACTIQIKNGKGFIAGSNERSILFAAYWFLKELGYQWIRPGKNGEIIPSSLPAKINILKLHQPSNEHRGVCIEGAVSLQNVLDMVEWMPKAGYNEFFMQFREGYIFFDRWYSHDDNPSLQRKEKFDRAMAIEYTKLIEKEIAKRSLAYHAVGHGWHLEAFGVPGVGWKSVGPLPEHFMQKTAIVNNKHWIPWDIPMLTAMCYSDAEVQQRMADNILEFAANNKQVDYLHIWLDDYMNNKCECSRCTTKRPFDWYVQILNKVDEGLTKQNNPLKLVFLSYCDLLYQPLTEWIKNDKRFTFMYANKRPDYNKPLVEEPGTFIPEFVQNRLQLYKLNQPSVNAAILKSWMPRIKGDNFIFEYYEEGAETNAYAKTVWIDVKNFPKYGLNGVMNCQKFRAFFPTGFGLNILGQTLWDDKIDFEKTITDFYQTSFGRDGKIVRAYLDSVETIAENIRNSNGNLLQLAQRLNTAINDFEPVLQENKTTATATQQQSWILVNTFTEIMKYLSGFAVAKAEGHTTQQHFYWHNALTYAREMEAVIQPYAEPVFFVNKYFR